MKSDVFIALALAAAACGSKTPSSNGPAGTGPTTEAKKPPLPAGLVWKDMNADQRHQYMEETVMPRAKAIFVEFDATAYANMDCGTCHGNGADDGSFEMPDGKKKPLPSTPEAFMAWIGKDQRAAKYTEFMAQKVEPLMGELLHMTVFDPKTKTGEISCSSCHYLVDETGKAFPEPSRAKGHKDDHEHDHEPHH
jgi:hypothetical protein